MGALLILRTLMIGFLLIAWSQVGTLQSHQARRAETMAIEFLKREVPAWSKENGCFSCHNNGDAARALYAAIRKGYEFERSVLEDTTAWVTEPDRWEENKGDPGFSDKRLATIQFAAALQAALEAGRATDPQVLQRAALKLTTEQTEEGSWPIGPGNTLGSPATYGTTLATYMALRALKAAGTPVTEEVISRAESWLQGVQPVNVLTAATLLLAHTHVLTKPKRTQREECLDLIKATQTPDGGWGPYADSPPEAFDTAMVLLALTEFREKPGIERQIRRGRAFLAAQQNPDGSWPATTRPPRGDSYAQQISTTGWATLALLATRE